KRGGERDLTCAVHRQSTEIGAEGAAARAGGGAFVARDENGGAAVSAKDSGDRAVPGAEDVQIGEGDLSAVVDGGWGNEGVEEVSVGAAAVAGGDRVTVKRDRNGGSGAIAAEDAVVA